MFGSVFMLELFMLVFPLPLGVVVLPFRVLLAGVLFKLLFVPLFCVPFVFVVLAGCCVVLLAGCCVVVFLFKFGSLLGLVCGVCCAINIHVLPMHRNDNKVFFIRYDFKLLNN